MGQEDARLIKTFRCISTSLVESPLREMNIPAQASIVEAFNADDGQYAPMIQIRPLGRDREATTRLASLKVIRVGGSSYDAIDNTFTRILDIAGAGDGADRERLNDAISQEAISRNPSPGPRSVSILVKSQCADKGGTVVDRPCEYRSVGEDFDPPMGHVQ